MTDYNKISQWYAEQLGYTQTPAWDGVKWETEDGDLVWIIVDIREPEFRQKCREKYRIDTVWCVLPEMWACFRNDFIIAEGKDIDAAELACLVAIYEGREE